MRRTPHFLHLQKVKFNRNFSSIKIPFGEQRTLEVSPLWLRLNDPSQFTNNGQRLFEISEVVTTSALSSSATSSTFDEEGNLFMKWADGKSSHYPAQWLDTFVNKVSSENTSHLTEDLYYWNANFAAHIPRLCYKSSFLSSEETPSEDGPLQLSHYLVKYGMCILKNVPTELGTVEKIANKAGFVRHTNYGKIFDVIDKGNESDNLAQTNARIFAHTGNPYRDPFPGVQLLHCISNASAGGATTFTDGFAAAELLRQRHPEYFDILAKYPMCYEYKDPTQHVLLRTHVPVLSVNDAKQVTRIAFNNRSASVKDFGLSLPKSELTLYFDAWAKFDELANSEDLLVRIPLMPGDLAIFMNSRIMHGREYYESCEPRHIQGCYVDHDTPRSRVEWSKLIQEGNQSTHPDSNDVKCTTDTIAETTSLIMDNIEWQSTVSYGEGVTMLSHALQAATIASQCEESIEVQLAALCHDIGNSPAAREYWVNEEHGPEPELLISPSDQSIGYRHHAAIGAKWLESIGFDEEICGAVGLHVSAKRALVAMDPSYMKKLSQASIDTLQQQGGPMDESELEEFKRTLGHEVALRLRHYDDQGKESDLEEDSIKGVEDYRKAIYDYLKRRSSALL